MLVIEGQELQGSATRRRRGAMNRLPRPHLICVKISKVYVAWCANYIIVILVCVSKNKCAYVLLFYLASKTLVGQLA